MHDVSAIRELDIEIRRLLDALEHIVGDPVSPTRDLLRQLRDAIEQQRVLRQQLHQREEAFRSLVEDAPDVIARFDRNLRFEYVNPAMLQCSGLRLDQFIGKTQCEAGLNPEACELWERKLREAFAGGREILFEFSFASPCGWRIHQIRLVPQASPGGEIESVMCVGRDVTEQKRIQEQLEQNEQKLTLALEVAEAGMWDLDLASGNVTWLKNLYGKSKADASVAPTYQAWLERVDPADRERCERAVQEAIRRRGDVNIEYRFAIPDRGTRWLQAVGRTVCDAAGQPQHMIGIALDVTQRKRAEALMAGRGRALQLLATGEPLVKVLTVLVETLEEQFDGVCGSVLLLDEDGRHLRHGAAPHLPEEYNRAVDGLEIGPTAGSCGTAAYRGEPVVVEDIATDPLWAGAAEVAMRHGLRACWSYPIFSSDRQVLGTFALYPCQPRRPKPEELEQVESMAHLAGVAIERDRFIRALNKAKEEAEAMNRAKDQFLAVLSHELRTPLTPVLASAQIMETERELSPRQREWVDMIRRNAELQARLIDDLLDLTRICRGKLDLKITQVDLHEVIRQVVEICDQDVASKGLSLALELKAGHTRVDADAARIQQVLWNLLKNAVKFTPPGGRITIRSEERDGRVAVSVSDTGQGIEPDLLGRIFNPFEQGRQEPGQRMGGLGLGLSISKGLVDLHGGTLRAESPGPGKGATFTVELPLSAAFPAVALPAPRLCGTHAGAGARLLLVEDHPDTAKTLALLLSTHGYEVRVANSVASALSAAMAERFDLIISDIGLPDGSGLDLMRRLRQDQPIRGIAVSGYGMQEDVSRSREAGFAAHVTKPIDFDKLQAAIAAASQGAGGC